LTPAARLSPPRRCILCFPPPVRHPTTAAIARPHEEHPLQLPAGCSIFPRHIQRLSNPSTCQPGESCYRTRCPPTGESPHHSPTRASASRAPAPQSWQTPASTLLGAARRRRPRTAAASAPPGPAAARGRRLAGRPERIVVNRRFGRRPAPQRPLNARIERRAQQELVPRAVDGLRRREDLRREVTRERL
jgi:hypothetical protein